MSEQQKWQRKIRILSHTTTTQSIDPETTNLRDWLTEQTQTEDGKLGLHWLLAHCDDGVIWGELHANGQLALSCDQGAFPVRGLALRWSTLQQVRLFGEHGEWLLWHGPHGWHSTLRRDDQGAATECIDEFHLLWGNQLAKEPSTSAGFTAITEGTQGIIHAPPIGESFPIYRQPNETPATTDRARLKLRHYIGEDEAGVARISGSRLVKLLKPGEN